MVTTAGAFRFFTDQPRIFPVEARRADKEKCLIKGKMELDACRLDRSKALASEREKCLTDQPMESLKESISTCESDLKQIMVDIGGIRKILSED